MEQVYDGNFCWQFKKLFLGVFIVWLFSLSFFSAFPFMSSVEKFCVHVSWNYVDKGEAFVQVDGTEEINFSLVPLTKCPLSAYTLW